MRITIGMDKSDELLQALESVKQGQTHTHRMLDELEANHRVLWGMVNDLQQENRMAQQHLTLLENRTRDIEQTSRYDLYDSLYFQKKDQSKDQPQTKKQGIKAILKRLLFSHNPKDHVQGIPF